MPRTKTIGEPIPVGILTSSEIITAEPVREDPPRQIDAGATATGPSWPQFATGMLFLPVVAWTAGLVSWLDLLRGLQTPGASERLR